MHDAGRPARRRQVLRRRVCRSGLPRQTRGRWPAAVPPRPGPTLAVRRPFPPGRGRRGPSSGSFGAGELGDLVDPGSRAQPCGYCAARSWAHAGVDEALERLDRAALQPRSRRAAPPANCVPVPRRAGLHDAPVDLVLVPAGSIGLNRPAIAHVAPAAISKACALPAGRRRRRRRGRRRRAPSSPPPDVLALACQRRPSQGAGCSRVRRAVARAPHLRRRRCARPMQGVSSSPGAPHRGSHLLAGGVPPPSLGHHSASAIAQNPFAVVARRGSSSASTSVRCGRSCAAHLNGHRPSPAGQLGLAPHCSPDRAARRRVGLGRAASRRRMRRRHGPARRKASARLPSTSMRPLSLPSVLVGCCHQAAQHQALGDVGRLKGPARWRVGRPSPSPPSRRAIARLFDGRQPQRSLPAAGLGQCSRDQPVRATDAGTVADARATMARSRCRRPRRVCAARSWAARTAACARPAARRATAVDLIASCASSTRSVAARRIVASVRARGVRAPSRPAGAVSPGQGVHRVGVLQRGFKRPSAVRAAARSSSSAKRRVSNRRGAPSASVAGPRPGACRPAAAKSRGGYIGDVRILTPCRARGHQRGHQRPDADRLGDVVVHPGGEALLAVALHGVGGHRDDARPRVRRATGR